MIANGQGRGILPGGHPLLVTRARASALGGADLVIVVGTPLDFRLGYGRFGGKGETPPGEGRASSRTRRDQVASHCELAGSASGSIAAFFAGLVEAVGAGARRVDRRVGAPAAAGLRAGGRADAGVAAQ